MLTFFVPMNIVKIFISIMLPFLLMVFF
uniref:Uncharacterized protein n=1 Tax=Rhizophora mucronata TaxID=61149 RepID=A0A2P2P417_RHIMU